jgi:integrase
LLNYAVKREYIAKNPLKLVGNFRTTEFERPEEMLYYTPEEYKKYAAAALDIAQNSPESKEFANFAYYVFFSIAFYTGMRKGEINSLKWENIDGVIIKVRTSVSQKVKGGYVEGDTKTVSSVRDVIMPEPLRRIVAEHRARQQRDSRFTEAYDVCGGTKCLPDSTIEHRNQQYASAAGVKHIRIHDFRHTHASLLINEGINIMEVSRRLGHRDIKETLETYSHLYPREEDKAVAVLNRIL